MERRKYKHERLLVSVVTLIGLIYIITLFYIERLIFYINIIIVFLYASIIVVVFFIKRKLLNKSTIYLKNSNKALEAAFESL